jgi:hypothetical protein
MVDMRKYAASTFIGVEDILGKPVRKIITGVAIGKYDKPDITFADGSKLSCNKTNTKILMLAYGTDSDSWVGHEVELSVGPIEYQGRMQDAVLVAPISKPDSPPVFKPLPPQPAITIETGDEMDDSIPF